MALLEALRCQFKHPGWIRHEHDKEGVGLKMIITYTEGLITFSTLQLLLHISVYAAALKNSQWSSTLSTITCSSTVTGSRTLKHRRTCLMM